MEQHIYVYIDLQGQPTLVGQLWMRSRGRETASFEYDPDWLANPRRFTLEPALFLGQGSQHTVGEQKIFGAMGDSAPDRWGRVLMRREEARLAQEEGRAKRTLLESDYLLMVNDFSRAGALRFARELGGPFLASGDNASIPPLVRLPRLLGASENVVRDVDGEEDLRLLLAPGSSLGGARPKASMLDNDQSLSIAKFPSPTDEFSMAKWEALALTLAERAGIPVPIRRLVTVADKDILILKRFDREGENRIPFLSAMSMVGAQDNESHSYLEILDAIRRYGAGAQQESAQLWRRIVFNILVSNTDDHLRNHAFLYHGEEGWKLSPAYDLNPVPVGIKPRVLSLAIDETHADASLDIALSVAENFGLTLPDAKAIAREVGTATSQWRTLAQGMNVSGGEIGRMESAFEHDDLVLALQQA